MVSAFATEARIVLGQLKTNEKSNEITAIPELLEWLDLKGAVISIDAMGCQKEIAKRIIKGGGDYIFSLKGNQSTLHEDVVTYFENPDKCGYFEHVDKGHGRIEKRKCHVSYDIDWLKKRHKRWTNLESIIMIESTREIKNRTECEKRFYISSCEEKPERILHCIRSHWSIENSLHWVLDMSFGEDQSRIRKGNAPENMAIIRHFALNLIRSYKKKRQSIRRLRKMAGWSSRTIYDILQQNF